MNEFGKGGNIEPAYCYVGYLLEPKKSVKVIDIQYAEEK